MKEAKEDFTMAKRLYSQWVPEEPISKFRKLAESVIKKIGPNIKSWSEVPHGEKPGPDPFVTDEVAIKIGTVYAQRLVWEHGEPRHYRDMHEVRNPPCLAPAPYWTCNTGSPCPPPSRPY